MFGVIEVDEVEAESFGEDADFCGAIEITDSGGVSDGVVVEDGSDIGSGVEQVLGVEFGSEEALFFSGGCHENDGGVE